jgi:hypothetical protein
MGKQLRRRWQFKLITLLIAMAICAVAAGLYGQVRRSIAAQERAFESIAARGGVVHVWQNGTSVQFAPPGPWCGTGLERVVGDFVDSPQFGDSDLKQFDNVIRLTSVDFTGSQVTPGGVATFRESHPDCHIE